MNAKYVLKWKEEMLKCIINILSGLFIYLMLFSVFFFFFLWDEAKEIRTKGETHLLNPGIDPEYFSSCFLK